MSSEMRSKTVESCWRRTGVSELGREEVFCGLWREKLTPTLPASSCKQDTEDTLCGHTVWWSLVYENRLHHNTSGGWPLTGRHISAVEEAQWCVPLWLDALTCCFIKMCRKSVLSIKSTNFTLKAKDITVQIVFSKIHFWLLNYLEWKLTAGCLKTLGD